MNTFAQKYLPSDRERSSSRLAPGAALWRAATAIVLSRRDKTTADDVVRRHWPHDETTGIITKAAVSPATIGSSTWAGSIAPTVVADAVVGLAPSSAAAELIQRGLRVSLAGAAAITLPRRIVLAADAGTWVGEGSPLTVRSLSVTGGPTLAPFKLGTIVAFTAELLDHSAQDVEAIVRQVLTEAAGLMLDASIFSATAASAIRPAGILNGATGITATSGGGHAALATDIANLIAALAAAGAGTRQDRCYRC